MSSVKLSGTREDSNSDPLQTSRGYRQPQQHPQLTGGHRAMPQGDKYTPVEPPLGWNK
jgi:hypothetical protein